MTGRSLIAGALRLLGVTAKAETMDPDEATDGLSALNALVSSWSAESLVVPADTRETFTLTISQAAYTWGTGGNISTQRPIELLKAGIVVSTNNEAPVDIIGTDEWAEIVDKSTTGTPYRLWAQKGAATWTLNYYPVPSAALSAVLYSRKVLSSFTTLDTDVSLLDGYERALKYNLALDLAPEYSKTPSDIVVVTAKDAKAVIERMNRKLLLMGVDSALLRPNQGYNIYRGPTG